ncbi:MAG: hypothetical protein ACE5JV_02660 [Nitrososphaerales archaeon]
MSYSDDEVKRVAELREWLVKQLTDREEEVARLKATLTLIDSLLKQASFRPAVALSQPAGKEVEYGEARQLKTKDEVLLANAYTAPASVTIVPVSQLRLSISTPPFQSFFLNRILEGMKGKDNERVERGELRTEEMINYKVEDENGVIKKIVVNNYREKERLNEVINTASWVFARMLEKTQR